VTTDGNVLGMATVVYAPPAVSTAANVNLWSSTREIVEPDLSFARTVFVLQCPSSIPLHKTRNVNNKDNARRLYWLEMKPCRVFGVLCEVTFCRFYSKFVADIVKKELEFGSMPNMMAALPNTGVALCWTPQLGWRPLLECCAITLNNGERKTWTQSQLCTW